MELVKSIMRSRAAGTNGRLPCHLLSDSGLKVKQKRAVESVARCRARKRAMAIEDEDTQLVLRSQYIELAKGALKE